MMEFLLSASEKLSNEEEHQLPCSCQHWGDRAVYFKLHAIVWVRNDDSELPNIVDAVLQKAKTYFMARWNSWLQRRIVISHLTNADSLWDRQNLVSLYRNLWREACPQSYYTWWIIQLWWFTTPDAECKTPYVASTAGQIWLLTSMIPLHTAQVLQKWERSAINATPSNFHQVVPKRLKPVISSDRSHGLFWQPSCVHYYRSV